jgi:hypothetical protein
MMMLVVVVGEELLEETAGIMKRAEALRILRPILHGFEIRLGEGLSSETCGLSALGQFDDDRIARALIAVLADQPGAQDFRPE